MAQDNSIRTKWAIFTSSFFPALISAFVDNTDILSLIALFLSSMLFKESAVIILLLVHAIQYFIDETNYRISLTTNKGLTDLVRELFGLYNSLLINLLLFIANTLLSISIFLIIRQIIPFISFLNFWLLLYVLIFLLLPVFFAKLKRIRKLFLINSLLILPLFIFIWGSNSNWQLILQPNIFILNNNYLNVFKVIAVVSGLSFPYWTHFFIGRYVSTNNISIHRLQYNKLEQRFTQIFSFIFQSLIIIIFSSLISSYSRILPESDFITLIYSTMPKTLRHLPSIFILFSGLFGIIFISLSTTNVFGNFLGFDALPNQEIANTNWSKYLYLIQICISFILAQIITVNYLSFLLLAGIVNFALLLVPLHYLYVIGNMKDQMGRFKNRRYANIFLIISAMLILITLVMVVINIILFGL